MICCNASRSSFLIQALRNPCLDSILLKMNQKESEMDLADSTNEEVPEWLRWLKKQYEDSYGDNPESKDI